MDSNGADDNTLPNALSASNDLTSLQKMPSAARKSHKRRRWIAISIVLLVLVLLGSAGGGAYFAYQQYPALNAAGLRFCNDLLGQKYSDAYSLLSVRLRQRYSEALFAMMSRTLDAVEGQVTLCGQAASNAFQVGLFPISMSVATELTRLTLGKRQGIVRFIYERGQWDIDNVSTSLLAINIDALLTAESLCSDMAIQAKTDADLTRKYTNIWSLYDSTAHARTSKGDFIEVGRLHDAIDGAVESCAITGIGKNNTDTQTQVQYTSKRALAVEMRAQATLSQEGGVWKFAALDASVYGRDMAPALTVTKWLHALASGDCSSAYDALSAQVQKRISSSTFASQVCNAPIEWGFYRLDSTAYEQESASKYVANLTWNLPYNIVLSGGVQLPPGPQFYGYVIIVSEGGAWKVDSLVL